MKRIFTAGLALLLSAAATGALAQTSYITDSFEVTLRTGPGIDHKIVAMLRSGQPLIVVSEGEEWTEVELPDGRKGYVLNRFVSPTPSARMALDDIRSDFGTLQDRAAALATENKRLTADNRSLQEQLDAARKELSRIQEQFDTLKTESADFFALKNRYERSAAALRESTERVSQLEAEVSRLQLNTNIRWFLGGAGVLVLGFLIGFSAKKQRRRSSLL